MPCQTCVAGRAVGAFGLISALKAATASFVAIVVLARGAALAIAATTGNRLTVNNVIFHHSVMIPA
jgi:hypothetical protein